MSFAIKRWSGYITPANVYPQPVIYIQPDVNLVSFAALNNNQILVKVDGTGLAYDNQTILGSFMSSAHGPFGCRPNLFEETGLYAIVLQSQWFGEPEDPSNLGFVTVVNLTVVDGVMQDNSSSAVRPSQPSKSIMASRPTGYFGAISNNDMMILSFGIFVFVVTIILSFWDQAQMAKFANFNKQNK